MKNKILGVLCIFMMQNIIFSQDTAIVKYLPLKVGNVWVYNWSSIPYANGKVRMKITSSVQTNGHIYYFIEQTGVPCVCAQPTYSPLLTQLNNPFRIDSSTGNIFYKSSTNCGWHFGEALFDSLKMRPDTFGIHNNCFFVSCFDTNNAVLFGNTYPSKRVGQPVMNYSTLRRYVKGFGLAASHQDGSYQARCDYILVGCVLNGIVYGDTTITGISPISQEIPAEFELRQNYPNPFNPITKIKFDVTASPLSSVGEGPGVRLIIYDVLGREITSLVNQQLMPGSYEVQWNGSDYPSGVYFYKLLTADYSETKKMVLTK